MAINCLTHQILGSELTRPQILPPLAAPGGILLVGFLGMLIANVLKARTG
jgi:hypothetical protein